MPQSFCQLYAHLVFSTHQRQRWLDGDIRPRVHAYLADLIRKMDSAYVVVGGTEDHVHLLFDLGKKHAPIAIIEYVKKESSKFVKTLRDEYRDFHWQRGYGIFSVGPTKREDVERYVRNQETHHRTMSFQDELRAFLDKYGIPYDERYVWN